MHTLLAPLGTIRSAATHFFRCAWVPALVPGIVLAGSLTANAGTLPGRTVAARPVILVAPGPGPGRPVLLGAANQPVSSADVQTLTQAYHTLSTADHDYKGHRVKAMKSIEAALKVMGTSISGDAKDKESQTLSDAQLTQVKTMVKQVHTDAEANNAHRVAKHLKEAIRQLDIALKVK